MDVTEICRSLDMLHPKCANYFRHLETTLLQAFQAGKTDTRFKVFETYRSPQRQLQLFNQKSGVTNAKNFQSAHQYGMAVDFVPYVLATENNIHDHWSWEEHHDWAFLHRTATDAGFSLLGSSDKAHVQWGGWHKLRPLVV